MSKQPITKPLDDKAIDNLAVEIGVRIVEARTGLGLSQGALATRTKLADPSKKGISRGVISLYETGVNKPGARELVLLCEALKVTPNWIIYGVETPAKALQASLEYLRGNDLDVAVRLAFTVLSLDYQDRQAMGSLALSLAEKKLGDIGLSSLMVIAGLMKDKLLAEILENAGKDAEKKSIHELISSFVAASAQDAYTNWGTTRPAIPEDDIDDFDIATPPPPRKLS